MNLADLTKINNCDPAPSKLSNRQEQAMIAIVDDDGAVREMLVSLVRSLGYGARAFASAKEFLGSDDFESFACITDIYMPGMNGFELKEQLDRRNSSSIVIMITAHTEPNLEERAISSGAMCLLRKPFEIDALVDCIERAKSLDSDRKRKS